MGKIKCGLCENDLDPHVSDNNEIRHGRCQQIHDTRKSYGTCTRCGNNPIGSNNLTTSWCNACDAGSGRPMMLV